MHENDEIHGKILRRLRSMTVEEFRQSLIEVGILNHDGSPSELYYENQPGVGKKCSCSKCNPIPT